MFHSSVVRWSVLRHSRDYCGVSRSGRWHFVHSIRRSASFSVTVVTDVCGDDQRDPGILPGLAKWIDARAVSRYCWTTCVTEAELFVIFELQIGRASCRERV